MGREVRMVPATWEHPKYTEEDAYGAPYKLGRYKPLSDAYNADATAFMEKANSEGLQAAVSYFGCVDQENYMPDWPAAERTHFMMYENTSEGTPISPAFSTPEELARWLADTGANSFGTMTATYDQWLATIKRDWAFSAAFDEGGFRSGVEALAEAPNSGA